MPQKERETLVFYAKHILAVYCGLEGQVHRFQMINQMQSFLSAYILFNEQYVLSCDLTKTLIDNEGR